MRTFGWVVAVAVVSAFFCVASTAVADTAQEVFICKLNQGKSMSDLRKVIADFNKMIGKLRGGERYQAWLLTPTAADDMDDIVWVGEMPDATALAALGDDYRTSEAGQAQDKKFRGVITCKSRSTWTSEKIR